MFKYVLNSWEFTWNTQVEQRIMLSPASTYVCCNMLHYYCICQADIFYNFNYMHLILHKFLREAKSYDLP